MPSIVFGAVADDDTGATDLAGMLAGQGLRIVLVIDLPAEERFAAWTRDCDAVILGVATRAAAPSLAYQRTREAIRLLRGSGPRVIQIKYCSTFDSTAQGNIGPSIDAALDELQESFTVALPALPVNGRTTYMGYHFVHQQLLSDSPMRHHPLTPMSNPNLVAHLQSQTRRKVGLAPHPVVCAGVAALREYLSALRVQGVGIAILDCLSDSDLETLCEAVAELPLITGSSAPAMKLPAIWQRNGWWQPAEETTWPRPSPATGRGFLIIAGSCSEATRRQNQWLETQAAKVIQLDGVRLAAGQPAPPEIVATVVEELTAGRSCLVRTVSNLGDVERVQRWASEQGCTVTEAGDRIARALAVLARTVFEAQPPQGLIVAGGETSGALCRTLELGALRVGRNIEPGVPLCLSLGRYRLPVVLKSGNFGSPDFYARAQAAMRG